VVSNVSVVGSCLQGWWGLVGGLAWVMQEVRPSGIIAGAVVVALLGVGGPSASVLANDNFCCHTTFGSVSLAGETFDCLCFSPPRGDECLPFAPKRLRRYVFLVIVDCLQSSGSLGNVTVIAVYVGSK
jgi:hypothetical protein